MRMLEKSSDTLNCSRPRSPNLAEETRQYPTLPCPSTHCEQEQSQGMGYGRGKVPLRPPTHCSSVKPVRLRQ